MPDALRPAPSRIVVAGDWHGNDAWAHQQVLAPLADLLPEEHPRLVLHLGDFGVWPHSGWYLDRVDAALEKAGAVLWFVEGNHEDYTQLAGISRRAPGRPGPIRNRIWHLSRGHRWTWHGRIWLALGGAVSVDRKGRSEGHDWWPQEEITEADTRRVIGGGHADVMVCHDAPAQLRLDLPAPPSWWAQEDLDRADNHRERLQAILDQVQPGYLMHGHYHLHHMTCVDMPYGLCRIAGLAADGQSGNTGILDITTMKWERVW